MSCLFAFSCRFRIVSWKFMHVIVFVWRIIHCVWICLFSFLWILWTFLEVRFDLSVARSHLIRILICIMATFFLCIILFNENILYSSFTVIKQLCKVILQLLISDIWDANFLFVQNSFAYSTPPDFNTKRHSLKSTQFRICKRANFQTTHENSYRLIKIFYSAILECKQISAISFSLL